MELEISSSFQKLQMEEELLNVNGGKGIDLGKLMGKIGFAGMLYDFGCGIVEGFKDAMKNDK